MKKQRILFAILAIVLVVGLVAAQGYAAESVGIDTNSSTEVAEIEEPTEVDGSADAAETANADAEKTTDDLTLIPEDIPVLLEEGNVTKSDDEVTIEYELFNDVSRASTADTAIIGLKAVVMIDKDNYAYYRVTFEYNPTTGEIIDAWETEPTDSINTSGNKGRVRLYNPEIIKQFYLPDYFIQVLGYTVDGGIPKFLNTTVKITNGSPDYQGVVID